MGAVLSYKLGFSCGAVLPLFDSSQCRKVVARSHFTYGPAVMPVLVWTHSRTVPSAHNNPPFNHYPSEVVIIVPSSGIRNLPHVTHHRQSVSSAKITRSPKRVSGVRCRPTVNLGPAKSFHLVQSFHLTKSFSLIDKARSPEAGEEFSPREEFSLIARAGSRPADR